MSGRTWRGPAPEFCQECDRGECHNCSGRKQGTRWAELGPDGSCRCAADGHPDGECRTERRVDAWGRVEICARSGTRVVLVADKWSGGKAVERALCGVHASAVERRRRNDEAARAERVRYSEAVDRERRIAKVVDEALPGLRERLAEFGVHPQTVARGSRPAQDAPVPGVLLPVEAVEALLDAAERAGGS